ncbi:MAG TPA: DUF4747 family protein [Burkholderiaceae bacterium]|nr:DUF4747 family protein [Burkholderiaceae bacterium]
MPRPASFDVGCINIRVHPDHTTQRYLQFWRALHALRRPLVRRSGNALMIGEVQRPNADARYVVGEFYRFIQINEDDQWFNIDAHKPAEADELDAISIPDELRPNLQFVPYVLDLKRHRLYVSTRSSDASLGIASVLKLLQSLVNHQKIHSQFGQVDLTVASDVADVDRMLSLPVLRSVQLVIERPNASDYDDERVVLDHLESIGASKETRQYVKAPNEQTLRPDDDMRALARVAASNGAVKVTGFDAARRPVKASSSSFPWFMRSTYNSNSQTLFQAFVSFVEDISSRRIP